MSRTTSPATILVVDDDEFMRAYLRGALESNGHRVVAAGTAEEAVRLATSERPSLVLLDLFMPGRSGLDCLPELVRRLPDTPVIVVSSMDEQALIAQALEAGARDFVTKPFHPVELSEAVQRALEPDAP